MAGDWLSSGKINSARPALALTATSSSDPIFLTGYSGLSLGSAAATIYTGTLTPPVPPTAGGGGARSRSPTTTP